MTGGRLSELVIRVLDPASLASWYSRVMGMEARQEAGAWRLTFPGPGVSLVLREAGTGAGKYEASRESCYWKIGVCVPDVELARSRIMLKGVQVSAPSQFMEVGFLCHLSDPSGFSIELLQHKFQSNFVPTSPDESLALGQPAVIGQITTRSTNIEKSLQLYRDLLGMKLLSIQDIAPYGFCLYFLGFTDDIPPSDDLHDVSIREWLWQRPYTTLEIQFKPGGSQPVAMSDEGEGVDHIKMNLTKEAMSRAAEKLNLGLEGEHMDHDGVKIRINASS